MRRNPRVSVIMTVFNEEKHIRKSVASVLNQTYKDFELIIVNDGSTDRTQEILENEFNDRRIKSFNREHKGRTKALNQAINLSVGEYIANLDADDRCLPERLKEEVEFLDENPGVAVVGTAYYRYDEVRGEKYIRKFPARDEKIRKAMSRYIPLCHSSIMMRKFCLELIGCYKEGLDPLQDIEDMELWIRMARKFKLANLDKPLVIRRVRKDSFFQKSFRRKDRNRALARLNSKAIRELSLPPTHYFFPLCRIVYVWLPNNLKRIIRKYFSDISEQDIRMKILFVSNTSRSLYKFRLRLISTLKDKGFEIVLCASCDEYTKQLRQNKFRFIPLEIDRKGTNLFKDLRLVYNMYKIYKKERPGLVFHFSIKPNIYGTLAAKLARVSCTNTVTGLGHVFTKENFLSKIVKVLYKLSFKFPKKIFLQNKDDLEFFIKNKIAYKNNRILVRGSGVDTSYFHPDFCKEVEKNDDFTFLFIGRMLWSKGIGELVSAAKIVKQKYPNTKVWLLGRIDKDNPSGISVDVIREWEEEAFVRYLGFYDDVRSFICQSDIVVLPSYYREGIPRSLLEAMASGKPIITTNSVGCKEVVEEGKNGFLIPVRDAKTLASAMIKFIELTPQERERMGNYGREKAMREFDENIVINMYLRATKAILNEQDF